MSIKRSQRTNFRRNDNWLQCLYYITRPVENKTQKVLAFALNKAYYRGKLKISLKNELSTIRPSTTNKRGLIVYKTAALATELCRRNQELAYQN